MIRTRVVHRYGLTLTEVLRDSPKPSALQTDAERRRQRDRQMERERLEAVARVQARKEAERIARLATEKEIRKAERKAAREDRKAKAVAEVVPDGRRCGCGRPLAKHKHLCPVCRAAHRKVTYRESNRGTTVQGGRQKAGHGPQERVRGASHAEMGQSAGVQQKLM